ncbi:hypothetical protein ACIB24_21355 [Spongisporangium articulatum]|uniref:Fibronectin type-III domain-containing protein n=1 Tax=Spongisporangium articulatum TaxID=3362603 RepID=A0ABW8AU66_9ACTN
MERVIMRSTPSMVRGIVAGGVAVAVAVGLVGAIAPTASAEIDPPSGTPATVTADVLPTAQVNGVVWSTAIVGGTVYAVGSFTKARPAGVAAGGKGEVTRNNALAFSLTTGKLLSWNPDLNAQARRVMASPNGDEIYVSGDFTAVGGVKRTRIAGFKTATGKLDTAFAPTISGPGKALTVSASTVYVGGGFASASGQPRTKLAAFKRSNGALTAWAPTTDDTVEALVVTGDKVVLGGRFHQINGAKWRGVGAVDATTGASLPWNSRPEPNDPPIKLPNNDGKLEQWTSWVTDLRVADGVVYGASNGQGAFPNTRTNMFDGRWAASASNGDLIWLDNCFGATYGLTVVGKVLYSVGHAHDCSNLGAFPDTLPDTFYHGLAETTYATGKDKTGKGFQMNYANPPIPTLLHWFPKLAEGSYTGQIQAAWTISSTSKYIVMGGEFPSVGGVKQQGLVRFVVGSVAKKDVGPAKSDKLKPSAVGFVGRNVQVSWKTTSDVDDSTLTYSVYRDGGKTPVGTVTKASVPWKATSVSFTDKNVPTGQHTYTIKATDPHGNSVTGPEGGKVTVMF